ncbi:4-hydroxy-tetrahydrodipicolinate reductase [Paenibacillus senegalensis]|uniref:4-hydroxy-tetrahydrodipicolinate reductase n=1 Tax=Paenibacillus senegalensis TaxID=1465766 RepID=UPI0002D4DC2D|nr:4-hydroxy-tetrahydrodipicolinate reductase [Paenibacillus senegalensis]
MSNQPIKVAVAGAKGRMGIEVVKLALEDPDLELAAAIGRSSVGEDIAVIAGKQPSGILLTDDLEMALVEYKPDVLVDFTIPSTVMEHARTAIKHGVRPVIGTTGLSPSHIEELERISEQAGVGGVIAPNFSIGAILMMKFAAQAAKYMPHVEIIEYHGEQKLDAPSGTSIKTAEMISQAREEFRQGHPDEEETIEGSRGGYYDGFRIHSVRLPGVFAQQEVVFGGFGQTLKIRHDSYERAGYMPGVALACKKVMELDKVVYGFDRFID